MTKAIRVSTTKIDVAGILAAVSVSLLVAYFVLGNGLRSASRLEVEASALSAELEYLTDLSESLENGEVTVETLESNMDELEKRLPNTLAFQDFYRVLTVKATKDGVRVSHVKQGEVYVGETYTAMPISIEAVSDFEKFHTFLHTLANLDRLVTVDRLSVKVSSRPELCDIDMTIRIYALGTEESSHGA